MTAFAAHIGKFLAQSLPAITVGACLLLGACGGRQERVQAPPAGPAAEAAPAAREETADSLRVVFLGDSLTAGYGLEPGEALPEQVEAVWRAGGIDAVAINAGVSGDTSANGLARFDWSVVAAEPDLVVVALGANDYLLGLQPDVTRANLAAILDRAKAAGIEAVLVGITLRSEAAPGSRDAAFAQIYPDLAEEYGVAFYPSLLAGIERDPAMLQADGLHPTRDGVVRIAGPLAAFLEPVLAALE